MVCFIHPHTNNLYFYRQPDKLVKYDTKGILAANDILPDYIGFVFAESSRRVTPDKAAQLGRELDKRIRAVGVFVNAPMEEILDLAGHREKERVIDLIQLHGDEDEAYIRQLNLQTSFRLSFRFSFRFSYCFSYRFSFRDSIVLLK